MLVSFLTGMNSYGQGPAEMPGAPRGSYSEYFRYFNSTNYFDAAGQTIPLGSIEASDGIFTLDQGVGVNTTAFFLTGSRPDGKICACVPKFALNDLGFTDTSGHLVTGYFKYRGKDSTTISYLNRTLSGYMTPLKVQRVPIDDGSQSSVGIDLLLVDPRTVPVSGYTTLGYTLEEDVQGSFYSLGFPYRMPMRIVDPLVYDPNAWGINANSFGVSISGADKVSQMGWGGAPLIHKPDGVVAGVFLTTDSFRSGVNYLRETLFESILAEDYRRLINPTYINRGLINNKMSALRKAILTHCWQGRDSSEVLSSGDYRKTVRVNNNTNAAAFNQDRTISSASGITSNAGTVTERIYKIGQQVALNIVSSYLRGKSITALNFPLQNSYPSAPYSGYEWIISIVGKEIEANSGFEYTASGKSALHIESAVVEEVGTGTISMGVPVNISDNIDSPKTGNIAVYPNPNENGIFYISFLPSEAGSYVTLATIDGKQVYKGSLGETNPYKLELPSLSKGTYVLNIYRRTGATLLHKLIVYR